MEFTDNEIEVFLSSILHYYGYDFRNYAPKSLKRHLGNCVQREHLSTLNELNQLILQDPQAMGRFIDNFTINVTEMFRDPPFFMALRNKVIPLLKDKKYLRVWHAGCSSGEEAFSFAILLIENDLYSNARLFCTDINESMLTRAQSGLISLSKMKNHTVNYINAGGREEFSNYYNALYNYSQVKSHIQKNIVWAKHNLVSDAPFNEFNIVFCRNVLIYFNKELREHVHQVLYKSLAIGGILALGNKETIRFTSHEQDYEVVDRNERIYRKVR